MKFEIMISILMELLGKKCVKAKYLAEKYEVCERSIYRYIDALDAAHVPVTTVRGKNGGFSLIDTYKLPSTFMTVKEFESTINALSAICEGVPNKVLENALIKLKAVVKKEYSGFDVKSGNLIIDGGSWGDTVGYKNKLKILQQCVDNQLVLKIKYHDRNGSVSDRDIEPHFIVFKQGLWYTYAYCRLREEFRFFKTGRIEQALITNEKFVKKPLSATDLPFDTWHEQANAEKVVLEVSPEKVSDVEEWLGVENVSRENGKFIARATLSFDDGLVSKIMSYGNGLKVLEPQILIDKQVEFAKGILDSYKEV
ncbi:MAG: WYL domain-containing protein [Clostridia bacterium]|nr:WYL domain-containing protein [Clostridia bacterium]